MSKQNFHHVFIVFLILRLIMSLLKLNACIKNKIQYLFRLLQIYMITSTLIKLNYSINIYWYHYEDLKLLTY